MERDRPEREDVKRLFIVEAKHEKHVGSQCHLQLLCRTIYPVVYFGGFFTKLEFSRGFLICMSVIQQTV